MLLRLEDNNRAVAGRRAYYELRGLAVVVALLASLCFCSVKLVAGVFQWSSTNGRPADVTHMS